MKNHIDVFKKIAEDLDGAVSTLIRSGNANDLKERYIPPYRLVDGALSYFIKLLEDQDKADRRIAMTNKIAIEYVPLPFWIENFVVSPTAYGGAIEIKYRAFGQDYEHRIYNGDFDWIMKQNNGWKNYLYDKFATVTKPDA